MSEDTPTPPHAGAAPRQRPWSKGVDVPLPEGVFKPWEHWAWSQIIRGGIADMSECPAEHRGEDAAQASKEPVEDPKTDGKDWPAWQTLSERFLRTILFHEPWASAPDGKTWEIWYARITDKINSSGTQEIDWSGQKTIGPLMLKHCRFDCHPVWQRMTVAGLFSLQGSVMPEGFNADGLVVESDLFCRYGFVAKGDVILRGARVGGGCDFSGASLEGALTADRLVVENSLFCRNGFVAKGDVILRGARVGGQCSFSGARLDRALTADRLVVEGSLFCRDGFVAQGDVILRGARVGGPCDFSGASLEGALTADSLVVEGGLFLRGATFQKAVNLLGLTARADVQLTGSTFYERVNLTGARIAGELQLQQYIADEQLQQKDFRAKWEGKACLILRNAAAGAVAGTINAFERAPGEGKSKPLPMDLAGFSYQQLGGLGADAGSTLAAARAKDLIRLLEARIDPEDKSFDAGPYAVLAAALERGGHSQKADRIRIAARNHELTAKGTPWTRRLSLAFSLLFVGYGHRNWRAAGWFLFAIVLGAGYGVWQSHWDWTEAPRWFWFSADNALPVIELDAAHDTFLAERLGSRSWFGAVEDAPLGAASVFYALKIFGLVSLTYLAAGLSGLASGRRREG